MKNESNNYNDVVLSHRAARVTQSDNDVISAAASPYSQTVSMQCCCQSVS